MLKRLILVIAGASMLLVAAAPTAAVADGGRHRHPGYQKGYRHGYHEGYERGYRRGYRYYDHPYRYDRYSYRYYYYAPPPCPYRPAPPGVVLIRCHAFEPYRIHVPAGAAVVWSWEDYGVPHTVTAADGSFDSGTRRHGQLRLVFDHPGEFRYFCRVHPYMAGTVIVTP